MIVFALLKRVPASVWAGLLAAALIVGGLWVYGRSERAKGRAEVQARWDAQRIQQSEQARIGERAAALRTQEVDRALQTNVRAARAAAAGARDELERLRQSIADRAASAGACDAPRAARAEQLLAACAGRHLAVAEDAQRYADQLRGWQALTPEP